MYVHVSIIIISSLLIGVNSTMHQNWDLQLYVASTCTHTISCILYIHVHFIAVAYDSWKWQLLARWYSRIFMLIVHAHIRFHMNTFLWYRGHSSVYIPKRVATSSMNAVVCKTRYRGEIPSLLPQEACQAASAAVKLTVVPGDSRMYAYIKGFPLVLPLM